MKIERKLPGPSDYPMSGLELSIEEKIASYVQEILPHIPLNIIEGIKSAKNLTDYRLEIEQALYAALVGEGQDVLFKTLVSLLIEKEFDLNQLVPVPISGNFNSREEVKRSWLTLALINDRIALFEFLLTFDKFDCNLADSDGVTPFLIECQEGNLEIVKLLLDSKQVDPTPVHHSGFIPFLVACAKGHLEIVKLLLESGKIDPEQATQNNTTPFFVACKNGHLEIVKLLLASGRIDPKQERDDGVTPLLIACAQGHVEIVKLLLKSHLFDLKQNIHGVTLLYIACQNGYLDIVKLLLENNNSNPNQAVIDGSTPFFIACQKGYLDIVKLLLKSNRIDPNLATAWGEKPLSCLYQNGHAKIIEELILSPKVKITQKDLHKILGKKAISNTRKELLFAASWYYDLLNKKQGDKSYPREGITEILYNSLSYHSSPPNLSLPLLGEKLAIQHRIGIDSTGGWFAPVLLLSDSYYSCRLNSEVPLASEESDLKAKLSFLTIMSRLPYELQVYTSSIVGGGNLATSLSPVLFEFHLKGWLRNVKGI
jgi:ankyrin repeat protein